MKTRTSVTTNASKTTERTFGEEYRVTAPEGQEWLARFAARMEEHRVRDGNHDGGAWSAAVGKDEPVFFCDGGALLGAVIAGQENLDMTLHVGLYWHTDPALRADLMGFDDLSGEDLADIRARCMDEHHHWVELTSPLGERWLFDPNGPIRREPYFQRVTAEVEERYDPFPVGNEERLIVIDPDDDLLEQLHDLYPASARHLP